MCEWILFDKKMIIQSPECDYTLKKLFLHYTAYIILTHDGYHDDKKYRHYLLALSGIFDGKKIQKMSGDYFSVGFPS